MRKWYLVTAAALLLAVTSANAADCPAGSTPLLILGSFHMAGSDSDAVKSSPEDVTTPERQREIVDLVARLAKFRPTKVAIEGSRTGTYWPERYKAWRERRDALDANEIEQVAFRLADAMGIEALSPVDYPMWMDGTTAADRHDPRPQPGTAAATEETDSPLISGIKAQLARDEQVLRGGTIAGFLLYLNSPERAVMNHRWDVSSNLKPGDGTSMYETTDYATNWYKRNLRIYTNLVDIAGPGERVFLLIGAGHAHLLNGLAADDTRFCRVPLEDYLG